MDTTPLIEIRASCGGRGVFALAPIAAGTRILEFNGERHDRASVEGAAVENGHDGFLQIGPDLFIGLSGAADDYVNHACNPNCYVQSARGRVFLIALQDIELGEELFFDYGLTQMAFPFRFQCLCGDARCRGEIGNYDEIPSDIMSNYRQRRVVPGYIERALDGQAPPD